MSFTEANQVVAAEIIDRFPRPKSAMISLLHLAQEQDGYVTEAAMRHIATLVGVTPAEVKGTASFYEMFRFKQTGKYLINVCTNISCMLLGGKELLEHACSSLGVKLGGTTDDGMFTVDEVECIAACTEAPCLQVNYRYKYKLSNEGFNSLVSDLRLNQLEENIPHHGTVSRVRQSIPSAARAGVHPPEKLRKAPSWLTDDPALTGVSTDLTTSPGVDTATTIAPVVDTLAAKASVVDTATAPADKTSYVAHAAGYVNSAGPKIVTSRFTHSDSYKMARYEATGGYAGLKAALGVPPALVHKLIRESVLLGRGGAGFPAGVKWGFLPPNKHPYYLVVNGDESEPGTYKDRLLMERDPHQLIEGSLITCYALGLQQCFLYVRGEMALAQERVAQALNDAYTRGYVGRNILDTDFSVDIVLASGAGAYIVGEETALIESLEGNRGMPRLKPPYFPAAVGLYSQPTIVNNVETISNLPWILTHGSEAYKRYGSPASPGTRMFAVSGHVKRPGVYEVEHGVTTFRDLIYGDNFCQGIRKDREIKAFIPGGGSSPWFFEEQLDLPLEARQVGQAGSMLGSGAIVVMDETVDVVEAAWRVVQFFARESCGKCTPCREGTVWLERILRRICNGNGRPVDIDLLLDVGDNISPGSYPVAANSATGVEAVPFPPSQTTICPLGPSAVAPIVSTVNHFRDEYQAKFASKVPVALRSSRHE